MRRRRIGQQLGAAAPPVNPMSWPVVVLGTIGVIAGVLQLVEGDGAGAVSIVAGGLLAAQPALRAFWHRLGYDAGYRDGKLIWDASTDREV